MQGWRCLAGGTRGGFQVIRTLALIPLIVGLLGSAYADAAVFTVTKTADTADGACDADCSLREAILAANALAGADDVMLPAGTYMLSLVAGGTGRLGTLVIADDGSAATTDDALTLRGAGAATTVIQQTLFARGVIEIQNGLANVVVEDVTIRGGNNTDGAGIITHSPTTIRRVLMTDCHGNDDAGAIMSFATLEVADSVFEENTAIDDAGALMSFAQATVRRSTFHKNRAGNDAGAIMNLAELTVENCTFSDNEAGTAAPGTGTGGAIKSFDALNLTASTLTANRAGLAGGGLHTDVNVAQPVQLEGNLVAGNLPDDCGVQAGSQPIQSLGHNLDGDGSCLPTPATGDQTNATPGLGPLADNGGPTMTHALLPGSPALDAWTAGCPGPDTDQRGAARPQGTACDIGAYELGDLPATTTTTTATLATTTTTTTTTITSTTIPPARCVTGGCDDGNPCTDDVCDPATGCQYAANTSSCSDGMECTLQDQCNGGQCHPGPSVTAGSLSTLITAGVNASVPECRNDKRKQVKKVVNPLVQAAKAFSRAEVAGVGTKKWTKQVAKGEKMIGTARSKLTKVQAKLSSACVGQLEAAIRTGALGDSCLR